MRTSFFALICTGLLLLPRAHADIFVANQTKNEILHFDQTTGAPLGAFVPSGNVASPSQPTALTFGPDGNLYVVSTGDGQVLRYNGVTGAAMPSSSNINADFTTGTGLGGGAQGITFGLYHSGDPYPDIYVTDANRVSQFNGVTGAFIQNFTLLSSNPQLSNPGFHGITVGADGKLYIADENGSHFDNYHDSIVQLDPTTGIFTTFVSSNSGGLVAPTGLTFDSHGNLDVSSSVGQPGFSGQVLQYNGTTGAFTGTFVGGGSGGLRQPQGLAFGPDGNLYVTSFFSSLPSGTTPPTDTFVARYDGSTGAFINQFASGGDTDNFSGVAFNPVPEPSNVIFEAVPVLLCISYFFRSRARRRTGH